MPVFILYASGAKKNMNKKEIAEIRKLFTPASCCIDFIGACYVDAEKQKIMQSVNRFGTLPDEDLFKYMEIFKKALSGKIGKNLFNLPVPLREEKDGEAHALLCHLRDERLQDSDAFDEFCDRIIDSYVHEGNYLILLMHAVYDVPEKASDMASLDGSEDMYDHILCCVCPMDLAKPGLAYIEKDNKIANRTRDWVAGMPTHAFLFPAFNDRASDIHSILYYVKDGKQMQEEFVNAATGCICPMASSDEKEAFDLLVKETFGDNLTFEAYRDIQDQIIEDTMNADFVGRDAKLSEKRIRQVMESGGADAEMLERYDAAVKDNGLTGITLHAANVVDQAKVDITSGIAQIRMKPEDLGNLEFRTIDGVRCIVIELSDDVTINGLPVND